MTNHTIAPAITTWAVLLTTDREVLNRAEVAGLLAVDPRTVDHAIDEGTIPAVRLGRLGRRVLIPRRPFLAAFGLAANDPEEKAAAVRMVRTLRVELGTEHGTVQRVATQLGYGTESVRSWVRQADIDEGDVPGLSTSDVAKMKALEQENRELRRADEISKGVASSGRSSTASTRSSRVHRHQPRRRRRGPASGGRPGPSLELQSSTRGFGDAGESLAWPGVSAMTTASRFRRPGRGS